MQIQKIKQLTKIAHIAEPILFLVPLFFIGNMSVQASYAYYMGWFFLTAIANIILIALHLTKKPTGYVVSVILLLVIPFLTFFTGVFLLLIGRGYTE